MRDMSLLMAHVEDHEEEKRAATRKKVIMQRELLMESNHRLAENRDNQYVETESPNPFNRRPFGLRVDFNDFQPSVQFRGQSTKPKIKIKEISSKRNLNRTTMAFFSNKIVRVSNPRN